MTLKTVVCMKGSWLEPRRQCWSAEDGRAREVELSKFLGAWNIINEVQMPGTEIFTLSNLGFALI